MRIAKNFAPDTDEQFSAPTRENSEIKITIAKYNGGNFNTETKIIGYAKDKEELKNTCSKTQVFEEPKETHKSKILSKVTINKIMLLFK